MVAIADLDQLLAHIVVTNDAEGLSGLLAGELLRVSRDDAAWAALLARAREGGISSWLYARLRGMQDAASLPGWEQLEADYWWTARTNTLLYMRLGEVLATLQRSGIRVAVLKGVALALSLYGNVAVRVIGDMDLLVPKAAMPQAMALMEALGYRPHDPEAQAGFGLEYENEIAYVHAEHGTALELHWHLIDAAFYVDRVPEDALWAEMEPLWVDDIAIEALASPAMLVHLCAHWVLHHQARGLRWALDIDQLVRHQAQPAWWAQVCRVAEAWQMVLPLREALARCQADLGTPIAVEAWTRIRGMQPTTHESRVYGYLTAAERGVMARFWRELRMIQGWRRKWLYLVRSVWPTRDYMIARYHLDAGQAAWPYYLYRLGKGLVDLLRALWQGIGQRLRLKKP